MLKRSIKRIFVFFEIFARNKKFEFFGQIIKSILQSVNGEEKLTNKLRNSVKLYNGKIAKFEECWKISKRIIKNGQIREQFGGHLVQTLPQTELKKRISKYFGKRCTSIGTLRISISFLGYFFCKVNRAWAWTILKNPLFTSIKFLVITTKCFNDN